MKENVKENPIRILSEVEEINDKIGKVIVDMRVTIDVSKQLDMMVSDPMIYEIEQKEMNEFKKTLSSIKSKFDKLTAIKETLVTEAKFDEENDKLSDIERALKDEYKKKSFVDEYVIEIQKLKE